MHMGAAPQGRQRAKEGIGRRGKVRHDGSMWDHLLYALAWASFGLGHSLLASPRAKARLGPWLGRGYRLTYNLLALLHFLLVAWAGQALLGSHGRFELPGWALALFGTVHLAGWIGLLWTARFYDGGRLLGLTQWRHPEAPEDEPLRLDGPHRYVRHPLYAAAFLILWGAAVSPLGLATAVWGSAYLVIGAWHEERGLLRLYGAAYADYRARVPAFLPWRGKAGT